MNHAERLEKLAVLARAAETDEDRRNVLRLQEALEWERIKEDPWFFIRHYCLTHDEHDRERPYKHIPDLKYAKLLVSARHLLDRLWVPKSRQMMVTWILCMYDLWDAMVFSGRLNVTQSKKEEDAQEVTLRAWGVYERLPEWIQARAPADYIDGEVKFWHPKDKRRKAPRSRCEGIPQGGNQIRSRTPSNWFSDESAFQDEWQASYTACLSCLRGGGRGVCVSTAWPSIFFSYLRQEVPGTRRVLLPSWHEKDGITLWKSTRGWWVLQIHYSADPSKDQVWAQGAAEEYGGVNSPQWQQEMEINEHAQSGAKVCPAFSEKTHVIPTYNWEDLPLWIGIDPGFDHPCGVSFITQTGNGMFLVVDEIKVRRKTVDEVAKLVKKKLGMKFPDRVFIGHDARSKTQASPLSQEDKWIEAGFDVEISYARFEDVQEHLNDLLRLRPCGLPKLAVLAHCREHIQEFELWRFPELTEKQKTQGLSPNKPIPANDDCMHGMRNVLMNVDEDHHKKYRKRDPLGDHLAALRSMPSEARRQVLQGGQIGQPAGVPGQEAFWDQPGGEIW